MPQVHAVEARKEALQKGCFRSHHKRARKEHNGCRAQNLAQVSTRRLTRWSKQEPEKNRYDGDTDDDASTERALHESEYFSTV